MLSASATEPIRSAGANENWPYFPQHSLLPAFGTMLPKGPRGSTRQASICDCRTYSFKRGTVSAVRRRRFVIEITTSVRLAMKTVEITKVLARTGEGPPLHA